LPAIVEAGVTTDVRVVVSPMSGAVQEGSPTLLVRSSAGGNFESVPLALVGGTEYRATLPGIACGSQLQYVFQAMAVGGGLELSPPASESPYQAAAGQGDPLTACAGCAGDFNGDGLRNPDDLSEFITCFFLDLQFPGFCPQSDFNLDGLHNPDDLSEFITTFFLGC
jgi:hypothetical protein